MTTYDPSRSYRIDGITTGEFYDRVVRNYARVVSGDLVADTIAEAQSRGWTDLTATPDLSG